MSRTTRSKNWKEFQDTFGKVLECDDKNKAMKVLNGIRLGMARGDLTEEYRVKRIGLIKELVQTYKKY